MAQDTVAWMAWGDAAFERARREKKLVFLHIGFPSCHWCHVMERESFQDAQVAAPVSYTHLTLPTNSLV